MSLGQQENIRYWLEGEFDKQEKTIQVSLVLHDIHGPAVDTIDLHWFEQAVKAAPDAYLAHDLMGWGHYKNQDIASARASLDWFVIISIIYRPVVWSIQSRKAGSPFVTGTWRIWGTS